MGTSGSPWRAPDTQNAWGWEELRRLLCRIRSELRRPVVSFDGFGGVGFNAVQWRFRVWQHPGQNTEALAVGADPRRRVLFFNAYIAGQLFTFAPFPGGTDQGRYSISNTIGQAPPFLMLPYEYGPLIQSEWWAYCGNGADTRLCIAEGLVE